MKKQNIILIGFMGVGKGTIARALVKESEYFAVDTDDLIESMENRKIKKIFEDSGEPYFRNLEAKCALWCEKNLRGTIISTGGGFYKQPNLSEIGKVIYLQSSFDGIINRLKKAPNSKAKFRKRPLLQDLKKAKELYNIRIKEYEAVADIVVNVEHADAKRAAKDILTKLKKEK